MVTRLTTIAIALFAAACGRLETPDLRTGVVVGRITGGNPAAAYVYPLGHPELRAAVAADGAFRVQSPAGAQKLVLHDGTFRQDPATGAILDFGHAQLLDVEVEGADVRDVGERKAAEMPAAGGVLAGARAETGARCRDPRFVVDGTEHDETATGDTPAAFLAPVPAGRYRLSVMMGGFKTGGGEVDVAAGATTAYEAELLVDEDAAEKGCVATLGCDASELECHGDDGRCHETSSGGGVSPTPTCGQPCASAGPACAAGLACASGICAAPQGCAAYFATVATSCVTSSACSAAVVSGVCDMHDDHTAGTCTAPCQGQAECVASFGTSASCSSGVCRR